MSLRMQAEKYRDDCVRFLRDMIAIPSESSKEEKVATRIIDEMNRVGFDRAWSDDYGNVIGQIGNGPVRIVFDGHIDTVGIGNRENWPHDPYRGKIENGYIYGRGASDNKAATAVQVYGARLFKDISKHINDLSLFVVGSVQEEDCDGLGLRYAIEHSIGAKFGKVDYVCMGECTDLNVYRGHRGRMEINVVAKGRSCHGSAPERGDNAVYKMNRLIADIERLNERLQSDPFLGKGTCAVTHISCETPSLCAVPDGCRIHIDRRLTHGEDKALAVRQIEELPSFDRSSMRVEVLTYNTPSYKNKILETEKYYPTWVLPENHPLVQAGARAAEQALGRKAGIGKWVFSTNGISSMGQLGIPTIGFGPAVEEDAHTTNDRVRIDDLVVSVAFYAALPQSLKQL
ncbi:MAG: YgeY family selenium metabolism-linked hydrolase [Bdellovibrionota bacterium]